MVGALSIVRFRNAVKSSLDFLYLFWSISIGIICGAGIYEIAVIICLFITILLFSLDLFPLKRPSFLLVVNGKNKSANLDEMFLILNNYKIIYKVKSKSISTKNDTIDLIVELRLSKEENTAFIQEITSLTFIENINLISHEGENKL